MARGPFQLIFFSACFVVTRKAVEQALARKARRMKIYLFCEGHETRMPNAFDPLQTRLVEQLDSLVPFLALAHREVFGVLAEKYSGWYNDERRATLPDSYEDYAQQVAHAAFLLGYSYAEAFVTDLIWEVYAARRDLLPADRSLRFGEVLPLADFENVIRLMIDSTVGEMNSMERKLHHLDRRLGLRVPQAEKMLDAHIARNALVHNAGRVNRSPSPSARWQNGERVRLTVEDVHRFGLMAREFADNLRERAKALCDARQPAEPPHGHPD